MGCLEQNQKGAGGLLRPRPCGDSPLPNMPDLGLAIVRYLGERLGDRVGELGSEEGDDALLACLVLTLRDLNGDPAPYRFTSCTRAATSAAGNAVLQALQAADAAAASQ